MASSIKKTLSDGLSVAGDTILPVIGAPLPPADKATPNYGTLNTGNTGSSATSVAVGSSSNPTQVVSDAGALNGIKNIQLPSDRPPYYFRIQISQYSRKSWSSVGDLNPLATVILPLPLKIGDGQRVVWDQENLGPVGATMMNVPGITSFDDAIGKSFDAFKGNLEQIASSAATNFGTELFGSVVGQGAAGIMAAKGFALNNFLTVMLKGPAYKTHQLSWMISPKDTMESGELALLYKLINNAQAPRLSGSAGLFFGYPMIFELSYHHDGGDLGGTLHRFKKSVLTEASWDFSPMSHPSFYGRTKAPESVQFSFNFTELEYWLSGQYL